MACKACGGAPMVEVIRSDNSVPQGGGYTLSTYLNEDGTFQTNWCGQCLQAGKTVYVVGRHSEQEKLFTRTQLAEASEYAKTIWPTTFENIASAELPVKAVTDLYG